MTHGTIQATKNFLGSYKELMRAAGRIRLEMERFSACSDSLGRELEEISGQTKAVERAIDSVTDLTAREVLIRRYIYGDTLEEIAEALCYSPRHIQRIVNKSAEELAHKEHCTFEKINDIILKE